LLLRFTGQFCAHEFTERVGVLVACGFAFVLGAGGFGAL